MLNSKLLPLHHWHDRHEYLGRRFFVLTVVAALCVHAAGIYIWELMPKVQVVDVPVHALSIKLGDGDDMPLEEIQPATNNNATIENTVSRLVRDQDPENQARAQTVANSMDKAMSALDKAVKTEKPAAPPAKMVVVKGKFDVRSEGVNVAAPVMPVTERQFVRDDGTQAQEDKKLGGDNAHDSEMISRYEQLISSWIQKFKLYPNEARSQNMEGETIVRIRIDRHGNIRYYALEHSTGHTLLDHAAIDMIRRANPVPAVPNDYPQGDLMEFLIPVSFHLES